MESFSAFHWIIAIFIMAFSLGIMALPFYLIIKLFRGAPVSFCMTCGHEGRGFYRTKGSILIELVLWLMLIVPGVIYSLWRVSTRRVVCAECSSESLVPPGSPMAQKLRAEFAATLKYPPLPPRHSPLVLNCYLT